MMKWSIWEMFRSLHRYSGAFKPGLGWATQRQSEQFWRRSRTAFAVRFGSRWCSEQISGLGGFQSKTSLFLAAFILPSVLSYSDWPASKLKSEELSPGVSKSPCYWEYPKLFKTSFLSLFCIMPCPVSIVGVCKDFYVYKNYIYDNKCLSHLSVQTILFPNMFWKHLRDY